MMPDEATALLRDLKARRDIHDVLIRYCRGVDRCDMELALSAFHADAWDEHGSSKGPAAEVMAWALNMHRTQTVTTTHKVMNEYVEIDGDHARVESYIEGRLRFERDGQLFDLVGNGRYLDRFECRDGAWRIAHRLVVADSNRVDVVTEIPEGEMNDQYAAGGREAADPAHAFFLELYDPPPWKRASKAE